MIPWALAAVVLTRTVDIGVAVSSSALTVVQRAATYATNWAVAEFAAELSDCCQVAESARGR